MEHCAEQGLLPLHSLHTFLEGSGTHVTRVENTEGVSLWPQGAVYPSCYKGKAGQRKSREDRKALSCRVARDGLRCHQLILWRSRNCFPLRASSSKRSWEQGAKGRQQGRGPCAAGASQ